MMGRVAAFFIVKTGVMWKNLMYSIMCYAEKNITTICASMMNDLKKYANPYYRDAKYEILRIKYAFATHLIRWRENNV